MSSGLDEGFENSIVAQRVNLARSGNNPYLVSRLESGLPVMADRQMVVGHCILLADPVVSSLNDLDGFARQTFLADMGLVGDAMLCCSDACRSRWSFFLLPLREKVPRFRADEGANTRLVILGLAPSIQSAKFLAQ